MSAKITYKDKDGNYGRLDTSRLTGKDGNEIKKVVNATVDRVESLEARRDAEPIDSSKSYSEGEIVYAEGASWRVAAGGANAGDLPSTHPDKFVSFQEGVTSIANKEAAYALTGVAVGTVYKTEDTGQILERAAKLDLAADFVIVGNAAGMLGVTLAGTYSADTVGQNSPPSSDVGYLGFYCNENSSGNNMSVTYESGKWIIKGSMQAFESAGGEAHPADVTAWTALSGATGTIDSVTRNEPRNWKHDGTILVYDNDEKILLTNLPDGQQVKIVGEGGRIEQLPPSPLPDIKRGFIISSDGNPRSSTSDGGNSVSGAYFWHEVDSMFVRDDNGSSYNAYIYHDGARWNIGYQSGFGYFQSDPCASTVHPADATGWTAYDVGSGIGQGTIADGGLVKTRACEVYDSPQYETSGNSLWFDIISTAEIIIDEQSGWTNMTWDGIVVAISTTENLGWYKLDRSYEIITAAGVLLLTLDGVAHTPDGGSPNAGALSIPRQLNDTSKFTAMFGGFKNVREIKIQSDSV